MFADNQKKEDKVSGLVFGSLPSTRMFLFLGRGCYRDVHLSGLKLPVPGVLTLIGRHCRILLLDLLRQDMHAGHREEDIPSE